MVYAGNPNRLSRLSRIIVAVGSIFLPGIILSGATDGRCISIPSSSAGNKIAANPLRPALRSASGLKTTNAPSMGFAMVRKIASRKLPFWLRNSVPLSDDINASFTPIISADDAALVKPAHSRYFFNLLDRQSKYAAGFFPGGIFAQAMPAQREVAETWYQFLGSGRQTDLLYSEVKWGMDQWTVSVEAPYQHLHINGSAGVPSRNSDGFNNFAVSLRSPVYQFVSKDKFWDYSLVPDFEIDAPSGSSTDTGTILTPQIYQLLAIGRHFSFQGSFGVSFLTGSHLGGQRQMIWSTIFGYNLYHSDMPIPYISDITPLMEIVGSAPVSGPSSGQQALTIDIGAEINPMPKWGYFTPYIGFAAGPALTQSARKGGDWMWSGYIAFALP